MLVNLGIPNSQTTRQEHCILFNYYYYFIYLFIYSFFFFFKIEFKKKKKKPATLTTWLSRQSFSSYMYTWMEKCTVAIKHLNSTRHPPKPGCNQTAPHQLVKGKLILSVYTHSFSTIFLYYFTSDKTVCSWRYLISATFRKTDYVDLLTWRDRRLKF